MASERAELLGDIEYCDKVQNFEKALLLYKEASDLKPNKLEIYHKLGRTYERVRDYEEAISNYKKALRRNKNDFTSWYRMGLVCIKSNLRQEGINALTKAHQIDPEDVQCLVKLGEIFSRDDKTLSQSENYLLKALEIDNNIPEAHVTLGRILDKRGQDE